MSQNGPKYHSAFIELAKGSEIRPLRSRRNFVYLLAAVALVAFGSGLVTYTQFMSGRAPAASQSTALPVVPEAVAPMDLSPDTIEKMQEQLHDGAPEPRQ